jgi:hypothetical protein
MFEITAIRSEEKILAYFILINEAGTVFQEKVLYREP